MVEKDLFLKIKKSKIVRISPTMAYYETLTNRKKNSMLAAVGDPIRTERLKVDLTLPFCKREFQSCVFYKIHSILLVI